MAVRKKLSLYKRVCRRCNKDYNTTAKSSQVCDDCKLKTGKGGYNKNG